MFWMLFTLLPLYTAFVASLTEYQNLGKTFLYPTDWAWHNYADVFTRVDMASFLKATFIYAVTASLINVVLATFAAYALSRFRFKGKAFYTCVIFITQVLPQVVIVVPAGNSPFSSSKSPAKVSASPATSSKVSSSILVIL